MILYPYKKNVDKHLKILNDVLTIYNQRRIFKHYLSGNSAYSKIIYSTLEAVF